MVNDQAGELRGGIHTNRDVRIASQAIPRGYVVEVEDRGLGMSDEELIEANARLENPPDTDRAVAYMLGLNMVSRLAQRHGIKVQLRHSWYGGITALTLLPHALLAPKEPLAEGARQEGATMAIDATGGEEQQRELEKIGRKFIEMGVWVNALFKPAADDTERPEPNAQ